MPDDEDDVLVPGDEDEDSVAEVSITAYADDWNKGL